MSSLSWNRRLVLEARENAPDGAGGIVAAWREIAVHWASLKPVSAVEGLRGGGQASVVKHVAKMRFVSPDDPRRPMPEHRMREGDRIYAIRGVADADGRREQLLLWLEEGANP